MSLIYSKEQQRSETSAGRTRTQCFFRKTNDWKSWVRCSKTISWGWQYPFYLASRTCCLVFSQGCSFCFTSSLLDSPHCINIGIFKPSWGALTLCSVPESDHSLHEEGHTSFVPQRKCKTFFFLKKSQGEEGEKIYLNTQPSQIKTSKREFPIITHSKQHTCFQKERCESATRSDQTFQLVMWSTKRQTVAHDPESVKSVLPTTLKFGLHTPRRSPPKWIMLQCFTKPWKNN